MMSTALRAASADADRTEVAYRGFLFADLRGFTAFVERHGSAAGADLLDAFRTAVYTRQLDAIASATKDGSSDFGRLIREHSRFFDLDYAAPFSNGLHKAVADATIFDPPGA
jgi:hypothetical protein